MILTMASRFNFDFLAVIRYTSGDKHFTAHNRIYSTISVYLPPTMLLMACSLNAYNWIHYYILISKAANTTKDIKDSK